MDYFLGEIRLFPYNKIPSGWMACDGQVLQTKSYYALFALLGSQFGGDKKETFALPDLRGRVPLCAGLDAGNSFNYVQGIPGGTNGNALTVNNIPIHNHQINIVNGAANKTTVEGNCFAIPAAGNNQFESQPQSAAPAVTMSSSMMATSGTGEKVSNMQPYLGLVFAISVNGVFPPRS